MLERSVPLGADRVYTLGVIDMNEQHRPRPSRWLLAALILIVLFFFVMSFVVQMNP